MPGRRCCQHARAWILFEQRKAAAKSLSEARAAITMAELIDEHERAQRAAGIASAIAAAKSMRAELKDFSTSRRGTSLGTISPPFSPKFATASQGTQSRDLVWNRPCAPIFMVCLVRAERRASR